MTSFLKRTVFFVQQSPSLAGSQKSLLRLMKALESPWYPVLIISEEGWLTDEARAAGVPVIVHPFPSSRSLKARLWGNRWFGYKVASQCRPFITGKCVVHGNDHIHSLCVLAVASMLNAHSLLTLRTPGMDRRDFLKYSCGQHGATIAVGRALYEKVRSWNPKFGVHLIENGVDDAEICSNSDVFTTMAQSIVVPGSTEPRKGWRDLTDALVLLEKQGQGREIEFVLLGNDYGQDVDNVVGSDRLKQFRIRHIPLTPDFKETVASYQFAVHPSRSESFGMALLEVLAAGIPVLSSRTGVADEVIADERFLFTSKNVKALAGKMASLMDDFSGADQMVRYAQQVIKSHYCVSRTAAQYMDVYEEVLADRGHNEEA